MIFAGRLCVSTFQLGAWYRRASADIHVYGLITSSYVVEPEHPAQGAGIAHAVGVQARAACALHVGEQVVDEQGIGGIPAQALERAQVDPRLRLAATQDAAAWHPAGEPQGQ